MFDYIYEILYSLHYRETYKEFLKIDFPRVPYPTDQEMFWKLVVLGSELRGLHLLDAPVFDDIVWQQARLRSKKPAIRTAKCS